MCINVELNTVKEQRNVYRSLFLFASRCILSICVYENIMSHKQTCLMLTAKMITPITMVSRLLSQAKYNKIERGTKERTKK